MAGSYTKIFSAEMNCVSSLVGRAERPEIFSAVFFNSPRQVYCGEFLLKRQFQVREALVVFEPEVELGLVLTDEIILEESGFFSRVSKDKIDFLGFREDLFYFWIRSRKKIGLDSIL